MPIVLYTLSAKNISVEVCELLFGASKSSCYRVGGREGGGSSGRGVEPFASLNSRAVLSIQL